MAKAGKDIHLYETWKWAQLDLPNVKGIQFVIDAGEHFPQSTEWEDLCVLDSKLLSLDEVEIHFTETYNMEIFEALAGLKHIGAAKTVHVYNLNARESINLLEKYTRVKRLHVVNVSPSQFSETNATQLESVAVEHAADWDIEANNYDWIFENDKIREIHISTENPKEFLHYASKAKPDWITNFRLRFNGYEIELVNGS